MRRSVLNYEPPGERRPNWPVWRAVLLLALVAGSLLLAAVTAYTTGGSGVDIDAPYDE